MNQTNHIDQNAIPKPVGAPRQDIAELYRYLHLFVGDLQYRLEIIERRLEAIEKKSGSRQTGSGRQ